MEKHIRINTKKVASFLRGLTKAEFIYAEHCMDMSKSFKNLINTYGISKEEFCRRCEIEDIQYDDYINGAFNYAISDMAHLNAMWADYKMEELKEKAPCKVLDKSV